MLTNNQFGLEIAPVVETINTTQQFNISIFEVDKQKGMVNLTKIAKHFGKRLDNWKNLQSTKDFLQAMQEEANTEIQVSVKGGDLSNFEQGTWGTKEVALELAQWISPKFKVFCIKKLDTLFQEGTVSLQQALPTTYKEALQQLIVQVEINEQLEQQQQIDKPYVEFAKQIEDSTGAIDFASASQVMKLGYGRNILFSKCRDKSILKQSNMPYQEYVDAGYFVVVETSYTNPKTGDRQISLKTMITGRGQKWLIKTLNSKSYE